MSDTLEGVGFLTRDHQVYDPSIKANPSQDGRAKLRVPLDRWGDSRATEKADRHFLCALN